MRVTTLTQLLSDTKKDKKAKIHNCSTVNCLKLLEIQAEEKREIKVILFSGIHALRY